MANDGPPLIIVEPAVPPPVPTPIVRINDYVQWQTDHPTAPLPADWVAADFDLSNDGINLLQDRLALIQRDDGALVNGIVTADSLDESVLAVMSEAEANAVAAALAAADSAAQSAADAATSASHAASSAIDAATAADAATSAFLAEQGAQAAQAAAEAAAANLPGPPHTAGKVLQVNPAGTAYIEADALMLDTVDDKFNGRAKVIKNVALAVNPADATPLSQVQGLISGSGAVPPPLLADVDKVLTVTGAAAYNWLAMVVARISDATAYAKAFLTGVGNAGQAQAYLQVPPTARLVATPVGGGLQGGGDLSADRSLILTDTGVGAAAYVKPNLTIDAKGRVVVAANGSTTQDVPVSVAGDAGKFLKTTAANVFAWAAIVAADLSDATAYMKGLLTGIADANALRTNIGAVPTSRTVGVTAPITGGGDLSANRTIGHADTAVVPGSYTAANITVDQKGHITAAASGSAASGAAIISAAVHAPALADNGKAFIYTNAAGCVVTVPAAAGLVDGWNIDVLSGPGAGVITFNRSSTDNLISKATALTALSLPTPGDGGNLRLGTVADARFWWTGVRSKVVTFAPTGLSQEDVTAHGLGVIPDQHWMWLVNRVANVGYAVGDVVAILFCNVNSGAGGGLWYDAVNVHTIQANSVFWITNKTTFAIATTTSANNWSIRSKVQVVN